MAGRGAFAPADATTANASAEMDGRSADTPIRCAFMLRKKEMKETIRAMKRNAPTPEDLQAVYELKQKMREDYKCMWKGSHRCHKNSGPLVAKHVADITVPDNSVLPPDTPVTKTWRLRNAGTAEWPAESQLIFVSRRGDNLNGPERVQVQGPILPEQEVDVSVTFITPSAPGRYTGYYRMTTSDGMKFGQRVWVSFIVVPTPSAPKEAVVAGSSRAATPTTKDVTMD